MRTVQRHLEMPVNTRGTNGPQGVPRALLQSLSVSFRPNFFADFSPTTSLESSFRVVRPVQLERPAHGHACGLAPSCSCIGKETTTIGSHFVQIFVPWGLHICLIIRFVLQEENVRFECCTLQVLTLQVSTDDAASTDPCTGWLQGQATVPCGLHTVPLPGPRLLFRLIPRTTRPKKYYITISWLRCLALFFPSSSTEHPGSTPQTFEQTPVNCV
jgi:hypothetical protein